MLQRNEMNASQTLHIERLTGINMASYLHTCPRQHTYNYQNNHILML